MRNCERYKDRLETKARPKIEFDINKVIKQATENIKSLPISRYHPQWEGAEGGGCTSSFIGRGINNRIDSKKDIKNESVKNIDEKVIK